MIEIGRQVPAMSLTFLPEIREVVCLRMHECLEIDGFFKPHYLKKVRNYRY